MENFNFDEKTQGYWKDGLSDKEKEELSKKIAQNENNLGMDENPKNYLNKEEMSTPVIQNDTERGNQIFADIKDERLYDEANKTLEQANKNGTEQISKINEIQKEIDNLMVKLNELEKQELNSSGNLEDYGSNTELAKNISSKAIDDLSQKILDKRVELDKLISNN